MQDHHRHRHHALRHPQVAMHHQMHQAHYQMTPAHHQMAPAQDQYFDPYSVYSDEDVWFSESRLFEDHLDEVFNKWQLLDDDIWCKLIIMERNRRIGKAYARVPIVTIDGSDELSFDGHKLALNGFYNPDRDAKIDECRKRVGKGVRIKMDQFGNILIKRLSKAPVFVRQFSHSPNFASSNPSLAVSASAATATTTANESINLSSTNNTNGQDNRSTSASSSTSSSTSSSSSSAGGHRVHSAAPNDSSLISQPQMPSRQQLIQKQRALMAAANGNSAALEQIQQQLVVAQQQEKQKQLQLQKITNSAICDEIIQLNGQLEPDKIYALFDMKKFQANVSRELRRQYPNKQKLERQCFPIIGLVRDAQNILDMPIWVMVINIVAIEMLNEQLPLSNSHSFIKQQHQILNNNVSNYLAMSASNNNNNNNNNGRDNINLPRSATKSNNRKLSSVSTPDFVNIFNATAANQKQSTTKSKDDDDPYTLPANSSSNSDGKSSVNNYASSTGLTTSSAQPPASSRMFAAHRSRFQSRNESIYSPGHTLVPPTCNNITNNIKPDYRDASQPPKLPPRDFVGQRRLIKNALFKNNNKFPTNQKVDTKKGLNNSQDTTTDALSSVDKDGKKSRKSKKNKFLQSLMPLSSSLSSSSSSSSSAATPQTATASVTSQAVASAGKRASSTSAPASSSKGNKKDSKHAVLEKDVDKGVSKSIKHVAKSGASRLASKFMLSKQKKQNCDDVTSANNSTIKQKLTKTNKLAQQDDDEEDDNYVHISDDNDNEDVNNENNEQNNQFCDDDRCNGECCPPRDASYDELGIPTPDYETDDNTCSTCPPIEYSQYPQTNNANLHYFPPNEPLNETRERIRRIRAINNNNNNNNDQDNGESNYATMAVYARDASTASANHITRPSRSALMMKNASDMYLPASYQASSGRSRSNGYSDARESRSLQQTAAANYHTANSNQQPRHRSASVQRYYATSELATSAPANRSHLDRHRAGHRGGSAYENPYAAASVSNFNQNPKRITSNSRLVRNQLAATTATNYNNNNSNYDVGRSSSGIYGNNSNSSSSDYMYWQPTPQLSNQLRKTNSSGYLNSVFRSNAANSTKFSDYHSHHNQNMHHLNQDPIYCSSSAAANKLTSTPRKTNASMIANDTNFRLHRASQKAATGLGKQQVVTNYDQRHEPISLSQESRKATNGRHTSRDLENLISRRSRDTTLLHYHVDDGDNESSNDSEPSYTNSSDELDIYDKVNLMHQMSRTNQNIEANVGEWETVGHSHSINQKR